MVYFFISLYFYYSFSLEEEKRSRIDSPIASSIASSSSSIVNGMGIPRASALSLAVFGSLTAGFLLM